VHDAIDKLLRPTQIPGRGTGGVQMLHITTPDTQNKETPKKSSSMNTFCDRGHNREVKLMQDRNSEGTRKTGVMIMGNLEYGRQGVL
jgi:hypothetical protein